MELWYWKSIKKASPFGQREIERDSIGWTSQPNPPLSPFAKGGNSWVKKICVFISHMVLRSSMRVYPGNESFTISISLFTQNRSTSTS